MARYQMPIKFSDVLIKKIHAEWDVIFTASPPDPLNARKAYRLCTDADTRAERNRILREHSIYMTFTELRDYVNGNK